MLKNLAMVLAMGCAAESSVSDGACAPYDGPRGVGPGAALPNLELYDCDGNGVNLDDIACAAPYRLVADYCAWCPVSITHTATVRDVQAQFKPAGVQVVIVVASDSLGGPPTSTQCARVQKDLGDDVRVVFDPVGKWRQVVAPESDTWFLVTPPSQGVSGQQVVHRTTKPDFGVWLRQVTATLGIDVELPTNILGADTYAAPFCHDMMGIGYASISDLIDSTPNAVTAEITRGFCECAVGGREAEFMDAYFVTRDYGAIFNGDAASKPLAREDVDYESVYENYLKPCAHHLDIERLEALLFGTAHPVECSDADGQNPRWTNTTSARGITPELILNVAFDRDQSNIFDGLPPLMPRDQAAEIGEKLLFTDRCDDDDTLIEGFCFAGRLSVTSVKCSNGCHEGHCRKVGQNDDKSGSSPRG